MDVIQLQQEFTVEFIREYRTLLPLWDPKSPDNKSRTAREQAYNVLIAKCRHYVADADKDFVKCKINTLRTSYRKEWNKVRAFKKDGRVHVPSLWYYNLMKFTSRHEKGAEEEEENNTLHNTGVIKVSKDHEINIKEIAIMANADPLGVSIRRKRKLPPEPLPLPLEMDVYDAIAKNIAHKLRCMSEEQCIIAERIVNDIMYHGQMQLLTIDSHLAINQNT